jgi:hypothetical protein
VKENEFKPYKGHYHKTWYDIRTMQGEIVEHCWPNDGAMCCGDGRMFTEADNIECRLSLTHPMDKIHG